MFALYQTLPGARPARRTLLRVGGLGAAATLLPRLLEGRPAAAAARLPSGGAARSCILIWLTGGPGQHETWDPKPDAPSEVRGPFGAISTPVPGLLAGELMPRLARLADRCTVIRSMVTDINVHTGSGYWMLTGHPHRLREGDSMPPDPMDYPTLGSVVKKFLPSRRDLPPVVTLPELIKNNPGVIVAGQHAGMLGPDYDPFFVEGDPARSDFEVPGLTGTGVAGVRLDRRRDLLARVNACLDRAAASEALERADSAYARAFDLVTSNRARRAFDLREEPTAVRERYGAHTFGQSLLLARRLVEAGVRLVSVHWPREPGDFQKGNPVWDTHSDNNARLKDVLMTPMDIGCSALLSDLEQRGLLDETLVLWMGEFGRTPKFNQWGGRDHWGHVFSLMLAGGGVKRGFVYGSSDAHGAGPQEDRMTPEQLHATIHHLLGLPPRLEIHDVLGRPLPLVEADPVLELLA